MQDLFQAAYRPNHSIETALTRVKNDILGEMDNESITALVLLNLSAAFDTINRVILLSRFEADTLGTELGASVLANRFLMLT